MTTAHRARWIAENGPTELVVMHICDTPFCIELAHLTVGTNSENMKDMVRKGRGRNQHGAY